MGRSDLAHIITTDERERFEKWAISASYRVDRGPRTDRYMEFTTRVAWEAWQARASMLTQACDAVSKRQLSPQDDAIGAWLSAALSDYSVCDELKRDIHNWMDQFQWSSSLDNCQMSKPHDDGKVAMDVTWEKE